MSTSIFTDITGDDLEKIGRVLGAAVRAAYEAREKIRAEEIKAGHLSSYRSHPAYIEAHRAAQAGEKAITTFDKVLLAFILDLGPACR